MSRPPFYRVLLSAGGVSLLSQGVALLRQILIVSSFGFARDLDFYATVYALLSVSVMSVASVMDSIYIGLLAERFGQGAGVRRAFLPYVRASLIVSVVVVALIAAVFPVVSLPFTAGFSPTERASIQALARYFLPWALLLVPFTAMGACMKSAWEYKHFFCAELMVTLVSTGSIFIWHEQVGDVALAYAYGYGIAVLYLSVCLYLRSEVSHGISFPWRVFLSRLWRHLGSNQVGTLYTMAERFWFSYLPAGGIAALGVVQQLSMSLAGLLSFRDAYLVALADRSGQAHKLGRLLMGLFLLVVMATVFVAAMAEPISSLLFQYGKAGAGDIKLVANLLTISMLGVATSVVGTPVWRLNQVGARYQAVAWVNLGNAALTMILGAVLIGWLRGGAASMAVIGACTAGWTFLAAIHNARNFGLRVTRGQLYFLVQSACFFLLAGFAANFAQVTVGGSVLIRLLSGGGVYGLLVVLYLLVFYRTLEPILKGDLV